MLNQDHTDKKVKLKNTVVFLLNSNQTTVYFPNHVMMAQGNTCTYINDLTNNNNSRESLSFESQLK